MAVFEKLEVGTPCCGMLLYRFEDTMEPGSFFGRVDPEMDSQPLPLSRIPNVGVRLVECLIVKETPKGWWVRPKHGDFSNGEHWVAKGGRKRYAYPTKEEARESYRRRKLKQIRILSRQLEQAKVRLNLIENNWREDNA